MKSKEWVEIEAPTVDEALILGLTQLGITRDEANIKVLDEGSPGFLGLGAREARVRVECKEVGSQPVVDVSSELAAAPQKDVEVEEQISPAEQSEAQERKEKKHEKDLEEKPVPLADKTVKPDKEAYPLEQKSKVKAEKEAVADDVEPIEASSISEVAKKAATDPKRIRISEEVLEIAEDLFGAFEIEAEVSWYDGDGKDRPELWLSLQGADAAEFIEQEGSVLNAAQFLTRILVRSKIDGNFNLILDANGHRWHHTHKLKQLARQTAEKAVRLGRPVRLQPMTSRERRYVHMMLRHDSRVRTKSYGSGQGRAVTVFPLKK